MPLRRTGVVFSLLGAFLIASSTSSCPGAFAQPRPLQRPAPYRRRYVTAYRGRARSISHTLQPAPLQNTWRPFARQCLVKAEQIAIKEPSPIYRSWALQQVASAWRTLDAGHAERLLERAWQESRRIPNVQDRSLQQQNIVLLGWAGLDVARARELAATIPDRYCREFAFQRLARSAAVLNPDKGVPLINAIPDKTERAREAMEAASELMREDPEQAVRLILRTKEIAQDPAIRNIIAGTVLDDPAEAQSLLRFIRTPSWRDTALLDIVEALAKPKPQRAGELAQQIKGNTTRAQALAAIAAGLNATDSQHASKLAQQAGALVLKIKQPDERFWLINRIARLLAGVNSRQARSLLEDVTTSTVAMKDDIRLHAYWLLQLAGSWAQVDTVRAESLFQQAVKLDNNVCTDSRGQFLDEGFEAFLAGIAVRAPERAATLFKTYSKAVLYPDIAAAKILKELEPRDSAKALTFAEQIGGSHKREEMQQRLLEDQLEAKPAQAERLLLQIRTQDHRDAAAHNVAIRLAQTNLWAARHIADLVRNPSIRAEALCDIGKRLLRTRHPAAQALFQEAAAAASQERDPFSAATTLAEIAQAALLGARENYVSK